MRRFFALASIVLLLVLGPGSLAAAPEGVLEGQLVNKTPGGASVAGQEVTLRTYWQNSEKGTASTKTDGEGRFRFSGLATEQGYSYDLTVTYQEAEYNSPKVSFDAGESSKALEMAVYDSTTSDAAIKVTVSHVILYVEEGSLFVGEFLQFINDGDHTYVGSQTVAPDGKKATLQFSLPRGASDLQYSRSLMDCCVVPIPEGFVDTMAVQPGTKEVAFSYRLRYSPPEYNFSRRIDYPTEVMNLLISGAAQAESQQLTSQGLVQLEGMEFQNFSGENLARGYQMDARLLGLPQGSLQGQLKWAGLGLAVLALALALGYSILKRRPVAQPVAPQALNERDRLLLEIARLDQAFEAKSISEKEYRRSRSQKKARLLALTQERGRPVGREAD